MGDHPERSTAVCGRRARRQLVFTSTGHVVHVRLEPYRVNPDYFVLSYEGLPARRKSEYYLSFDGHCCHIGTATKHPLPDRAKPSFAIFDILAL